MQSINKLIKLVTAALMAAMTCVATMVIQIPYGSSGYIHPGDAMVVLSGIILGPFFGGFAAGIGSMMADLLSGYTQYAIATLIIKLLAAILAYYSYRYIRKRSIILASILANFIVTSGYGIYEIFLSGTIAAGLGSIPGNLIQNAASIILSSLILPLLIKVPQIKAMIETKSK